MPILDSIASTIGSAVRSFQIASHGSGTKAHRPMFLNTMADAEKWKGGDLGQKDAAYKRAMQNSWIYTALHFKSSELAAGRLFVVRNETGMEDDGVPVKNHAFTRILRKPNPVMGRGFLWQYSQWWLDLSGNAYWFLAPDEDNNLAEIWPLPSNAVNPFPGDKERMVDYYEYTVNGRLWKIPAEYICHFRYPNPYDYFRGLSPLVAALLPSDADSAMAHWNGAFFGTGNVMPSAIINVSSGVPGTADAIDPQDMESIKEALTSGEYAASARRTVVTNAFDMAVNILGWNAKDMDFLAGRSFTKDEILNIMGIPPGMLDKNATEANATTGDNIFKEKTLWPLMTTVYAETITSQILERWYAPICSANREEAVFDDIRPINKMQLLQEAAASTQDMTRQERRARFWNLPPLGDERDNEIPGAGMNSQPADPGALGGAFPVPNMQNAAPMQTRSILSKNALADLRRWKDVTLKSLRENSEPRLEFTSEHIPFDIRADLLNKLVFAETPEQVKSIFSPWMPGEASTKASPFPLSGRGYSTHKDDPFKAVKRMTESELEQALREYFAGLAVRIGEQVVEPGTTKAFTSEGELKHPGHANQKVHGRKGGTSLPDNATIFEIYDYFQDKYDFKYSTEKDLTIDEIREFDSYLEELPEKFTKENKLFTILSFEIDPNDSVPQIKRASGYHLNGKVAIFVNNIRPRTQWTDNGPPIKEALFHEVGESWWKQMDLNKKSEFEKFSLRLSGEDLLEQEMHDQYAVWFSRYWLGDQIPPEIQKLVE